MGGERFAGRRGDDVVAHNRANAQPGVGGFSDDADGERRTRDDDAGDRAGEVAAQ